MKHKLGLAVIVLLVATLALVGALREVNTTKAGAPLPIKPVFPGNVTGGSKSTQLGDPAWTFSTTDSAHGRRAMFNTNWGFGSRGAPDISIDNDDALGTFRSYSDVFCNASDNAVGNGTDLFAANVAGSPAPWNFTEEDTDLYGNGLGWLVPKTSGLGVTARFETLMGGVWVNSGTWVPIATVPVNILTLADAWAPHTGPSQIFVSGAPVMPTILCTQDAGGSWAKSDSVTNGNLTSPLPMTSNSPLRGDAAGLCTGGSCADFQMLGFWGTPSIATGSPASIAVTSRILNSGPATDGDFKEVWEVSAPSNVSASWTPATITKQTNPGGAGGTWSSAVAPVPTVSGTTLSFSEAAMPKGQTNSYSGTLSLTCSTGGDYIVEIKSYAYPKNGDTDNDLMNNVAVSAIRVKCPAAPAGELDLQAMGVASSLWSIDSGSASMNGTPNHTTLLPPGDHVQLVVGDSAVLRYGTIVRNQTETDNISSKAILSASSADTDDDGTYDIDLAWNAAGVSGLYGSEPPATALPAISASCLSGGGQACAGLDISLTEPMGKMISIAAELTVTCTEEGKFILPVAVVNQAVGYGDPVPINNTFFEPGTVYCWNSAGVHGDGIDDSTGLYPAWSASDASGANVDSRKPISPTNRSSTAIGSDVGWADRFIATPNCWYYDATGIEANPGDPNDWVTPAESRALAPAGIDDDGDCLADAAAAQPGNAVDPNDAVTATMCPAIVYNDGAGDFAQIQYSVNADQDCDGLIDGLDSAFGSNPRLADTDGDGLTDYFEMFLFTSPVNPDSDGDGFLDMPAPRYNNDGLAADGVTLLAQDHSFDNCPGVYNPDQTNTDGRSRPNGDKVPGNVASNPTQDKLGDACDDDDDNDNMLDTAEELCLATYGTACDPLNPNTDGNVIASGAYDRCIDGIEVLSGANPTLASVKCGTPSLELVTYLKACHLNLPGNNAFRAYPAGTGDLWVENDPDGDGTACTADGLVTLDKDNDDGNGVAGTPPAELSDAIELQGYGSAIARKDTDGDGCADWIEIMDINGDRKVSVSDQTNLAKRAAVLPGFEPDVVSDAIYDVQKDGKISVADQTQMAKNVCGFKPGEIGCPTCPAEN